MSTKRAVLIAKDCRLLSNHHPQNFGNLVGLRDRQYDNIDLNQYHKCEAAKFLQSESKNLLVNAQNTKDTVDFVNHNNCETSKKDVSKLWGKNDLTQSNLYCQNYLQQEENKWQSKNVDNLNKSTLSLHIEAYENANEVKNVDEKVDDLKESKKDPFAFPRQQKEEELIEAEMMAFKLSKPLMIPVGMKDKN